MRRDSREMAFKIIFESLFNNDPFNDELFVELKEKDLAFCIQILDAYNINKNQIQSEIKKCLTGYNIDRVYKIDLALAYEAITEIKYLNTPSAVAINEVIELAKIYSTEKSPKFLNGLLSTYLKGQTNVWCNRCK